MDEPLTCPCGGVVNTRPDLHGWYRCPVCETGYSSLSHEALATESARRSQRERAYARRSRPRLGSGSTGSRVRKSVGRVVLTALLALVASCAMSAADPEPVNYTGAEACYEAFYAAVEGYERFVGPVSEECRFLPSGYLLRVVPDAAQNCPGATSGTIGCHNTRHYIWVEAGMSDQITVYTSVHEWFHALLYCETGSSDVAHSTWEVWGRYRGSALAHPPYWPPQIAQELAVKLADVGHCE